MITPAFDLSQDPDFLYLSIRVPYTRTSEFDLYIDGTDFKFYAKPYFLRLTLPGGIVEDGREKARFDIDKGLFTLQVSKETPGSHFEGLQMLTSLLAPKGSRSAKPLVEDVDAGCSQGVEEDEEEEEEFDWQVEQEVYKESSEEELGAQQKYGFANQRSGVFARLQAELSDVIDVENPEGTTAAERRRSRQEAEESVFSADHYLSDLFEDDEIKRLLKFKPWWAKLSSAKEPDGEAGEAAVVFSDDEKEQLRKFTNRSFLLDKTSRQQAWLGLVDILLAYCYEARSTEGEHNVESPWTIRKLSGTLCWLETYCSVQEVLVSFGRRVLCYPLYRHFGLVSAAVTDTATILQSGKACVLKCLLDVHKVFRENEPAYILNDLYITDYCVWIQRVKSKKLTDFAEMLKTAPLHKKDLQLELVELEEAAAMVVEESKAKERGPSQSAPLSNGDSSDDSSESSSSDSSDSSSSSSSSGSSDDESEESEAEDCAESGGGGGGGGETFKDSPPLPQPTSAASPIPREPTSTLSSAAKEVDALPSASGSTRLLIQELGEHLADDLQISEDSGDAEGRRRSQLNSVEAKRKPTSARSSGGTLLEPGPYRNPLLIVPTSEDGEETDFILQM